jgi:cysteine desulfurase/selenocysteine lyase
LSGREEEIVFTRGATEAINLVAQSWGAANLKAGDRILLSTLEHHSNIVPWQLLRDRVGIEIDVCPLTQDGAIDLDAAEAMLTPRTSWWRWRMCPTCWAACWMCAARWRWRRAWAQRS